MTEQIENIIVIGKVDLNLLKEEIKNIENQRQFPLQGLKPDDKTSSISTDTTLRSNEEDYIVRLYDDMDYTYSIIEKFNLYRTRFMFLPSITCYGYHKDNTPRIHVPIETNNNCFFVLDDKIVRLPADGSVYWVNTTLPHTFVNSNSHASNFTRIHLVGNTKLSETDARFLADHR